MQEREAGDPALSPDAQYSAPSPDERDFVRDLGLS